MSNKIKCHICRKHDVYRKDYRFIESCGLQGKVLVCEWCFNLNDVTVSEIMRDELNPKDYYDKPVQDRINKSVKHERKYNARP